MTEPSSGGTACPVCSAHATGRFCSSCGAPLQSSVCAGCNTPLDKVARFCHVCGRPAGRAGRASSRSASAPEAGSKSVRWTAATIAVVAILAWFAGRAVKPANPIAGMPQQAPLGGPGSDGSPMPIRGPDISRLSPQERADRLYNRVMLLAREGKKDSVLFFAPMAIDAYRMLGPLDARQRSELDRIMEAADAAAAGGVSGPATR